jgi:hypothetical protein
MRRIGIPVVLALAGVALAGTGNPATAHDPLMVGVDCYSNGTTLCDAVAVGGTGTYISYDWTVEERPNLNSSPTSSYQTYGSNPQISNSCTSGYHVTVTVLVKDSQGATAVGNSGFTC